MCDSDQIMPMNATSFASWDSRTLAQGNRISQSDTKIQNPNIQQFNLFIHGYSSLVSPSTGSL